LMTLKYIWRSFQPRLSFPRPFLQSLACFRVARSPSNSWASCYLYYATLQICFYVFLCCTHWHTQHIPDFVRVSLQLGRSPKVKLLAFLQAVLSSSYRTSIIKVLKHDNVSDWRLCCPHAAIVVRNTPASRQHPSSDNDSVVDLEATCCHHAVMVSQEHCCGGN